VSLVSGLRSGLRSALRAGLNPSDSADPLAGVTRDATSGIYAPATAGEWSTAMTVAGIGSGGPSSLYLMQEASGNLVDTIGGITLTATGASLLYQQAVAGWTRDAFTTPDGLGSHQAQNTTTAIDISTTSALLILYARMPAAAPAAVRRIHRINATGIGTFLSTTPRLQCVTGGAGGSTVSGTSDPTGATRPIVIQADRTNLVARVFSDQEEIVGTVGTYATIAFGIGSSGGNAADIGYLYGALFSGAAAELSKAQIKTLLQTLGWGVLWS